MRDNSNRSLGCLNKVHTRLATVSSSLLSMVPENSEFDPSIDPIEGYDSLVEVTQISPLEGAQLPTKQTRQQKA